MVALLVVASLTLDIPRGNDADEAGAICRTVSAGHVLPTGAAAEWTAGRRQSVLFIYGVRDAAAQDRVVEFVRATRERLAAKPVKIEFRSALTTRVVREGPGWTVWESDHGELLRTDVVQ